MEFAYGQMGLSPKELAELTPFQFELKVKGFKARDIDKENYFRKLTYHLYAINVAAESRGSLDIDDIWPNANTVKKAANRNKITQTKVQKTLEAFKKMKGL